MSAAQDPGCSAPALKPELDGSNQPRSVVFESPATSPLPADERDPLLHWNVEAARHSISQDDEEPFDHDPPSEPPFTCHANSHSILPVYTNIHRIKRDIESVVEDYLSLEQLRDVRINLAVVRPLVDKLYAVDDMSTVYCLMVNRFGFLDKQSKLANRQSVNYTRATLCELVATRILRRWSEDNPGDEGLLALAHILVAGFDPFQGAPEEVRQKARRSSWSYTKTLPALEVAILSDSKYFLGSTTCQKVIDGIYEGKIVYTPSSFIDLIPDRYKQKPITLYDPRKAPLLNQYRLIVPKTRNILEILQFLILLVLYLLFMAERNAREHTPLEIAFSTYAFSWVLDQFATILEHGWHVYTQNLWSFLDVIFVIVYWCYLILRMHAWQTGSASTAQQALDVLAMGAPVLVPRLAFNVLSNNLVFVSLRSMMADFILLTLLSTWCFAGFLLSMLWLGDGMHHPVTISEWMLWIWFGLDGTGITRSVEFHWLLGPTLMVLFAFLGNTLFLTILVSMLSHTFSSIVSNANAEIRFRRAVLTLEGVKSDAIFAYQPPFNLIAVFLFLPLKFVVSPRWFHKIHVFTVRTINLPLLLIIAFAERRILRSQQDEEKSSTVKCPPKWRQKWKEWRITTHGDLADVFDIDPPESIHEDIRVDDEMTRHLIRRQFTRSGTNESAGSRLKRARTLKRRDSMFPQLTREPRGSVSTAAETADLGSRLLTLENQTARMERMLEQLCKNRGIDFENEDQGNMNFSGRFSGGDMDKSSDTIQSIST